MGAAPIVARRLQEETGPVMVSPFILVQVSDLHLDPTDAEHRQRLPALREVVAAAHPDLVVVSGDVSADGYRHDGMFAAVKRELDRLGPSVHVIPGNHDVGDKPGEAAPLQPDYVERWAAVFGADRFCTHHGGWRLIGLNTQLLGTGLPAEAAQFAWLDAHLRAASDEGSPVALFMHAPPYLFEPTEALHDRSGYWQLAEPARAPMAARVHHASVRLVSSGHLHWHRMVDRGDALHVWCPSCAFIVDDAIFPRGGNVLGAMRFEFEGARVASRLLALPAPARTIHFNRPRLELPDREPLTLTELLLDFTGTLSRDGVLLPGVAARLTELARRIPVTVMTADTFGRAADELADLPLRLQRISTGAEKRAYIEGAADGPVVAIGNGRNDVPMLEAAAIGIAVVGPEGACAALLQAADVVTHDIVDALDLVLNPLRLKATLRQ